MRLILIVLLFLSCKEEEVTICDKKQNPFMTISDSLPIQFWVNGQQTYNEKNVCGFTANDCFCQPFNCDDEIKIQLNDDSGNIYYLVVYNTNDVELTRIEFEEITSGFYQVSFSPNTQSPAICEKVKFTIEKFEGTLSTPWVQQTTIDRNWSSIAYGNGVFVTVGLTGTGTRAASSPDGINWTIRNTPEDNQWNDVTFGNGVFVAVSNNGTNRVMVSSDGITWTGYPAASADTWRAITYGNGLFVAVNSNSSVNVMTSPDGVNWTTRTGAAANIWQDITYGNGKFVAVSRDGVNNVMTSEDGINWVLQSVPVSLSCVTYGNGIFVAIGSDIMISEDGENWQTLTDSTGGYSYTDIVYDGGFFIAVNSTIGSGEFVLTSFGGKDGSWNLNSDGIDRTWQGITVGENLFVAVGNNASVTGKVMTLDYTSNITEQAKSDCIDLQESHDCTAVIEYSNGSNFDGIVYETSPQPTFSIRVPAIFFHEENPQEREDLELSNGEIVSLRQSIVEKRLLELGFMPPYMHKKIQKILMHDTVTIDGDNWIRRDDYESSQVKDYGLKKAQIWLTKINSIDRNII